MNTRTNKTLELLLLDPGSVTERARLAELHADDNRRRSSLSLLPG